MFDFSGEPFRLLPLLLLGAVALIASVARGFSGFGGALIFMPVASVAIGPKMAAPLLLIVDAVAAAGLIPNAWRRSDRRDVGLMAAGSVIGIPIGAMLLAHSDATTIRWAIVVLASVMLVVLTTGWRYQRRPTKKMTIGIGGVAGLFGGAVQIAGPAVVAYWLGGVRPVEQVRANIALYFAASTVITIVSYAAAGILTFSVVGLALVTGPIYCAGIYLGARLFGRASAATFRRICYCLIALAVILSLPILDGVLRPG